MVIPADRTPVNPTTTDEKALEGVSKEMREFFENHAMAILTDKDYEKNTRATAEFMRKYLETDADVVPGEVGKIVSVSDPDDEWEWGVAAMKEIADHARFPFTRRLKPWNFRATTGCVLNHSTRRSSGLLIAITTQSNSAAFPTTPNTSPTTFGD